MHKTLYNIFQVGASAPTLVHACERPYFFVIRYDKRLVILSLQVANVIAQTLHGFARCSFC